MRINGPSVARLKLPVGQSELLVFDDELPRFGIRVRAGGKRTWVVQYRLGAKQRRLTIGTVAAVDADQARKIARTALAKVDLGDDPQSEKSTKRARAVLTLEKVSELYLTDLRGRLRPRSFKEVERHLTQHWAPLKELAIDQVQKRDVAARLTIIKQDSGPVAANRARGSLSAMFAWAISDGTAEENPVIGTNKPGLETPRDRVLVDAELADIWNVCREDDYGRIVQLLMLTGQRRDEVGGMAESELDLTRRLWTIPGERAKNGRPHEVPLSDEALSIVQDAPRRDERDRLFGQGQGSFSGWSGAKELLDERLRVARKGRGKLAPWTLHDLRRTMATRMGDLKILPHVVEAVLNHVSGHRAGVAGIYNRALYSAEKRQALDLWAAHIRSLADGTARKVIPMQRPA